MSLKTKQLNPFPSEEEEQITLFDWAARVEHIYPELRWMYAIPNGGLRSKREAGRFRKAGVKAGVSDIFLPAARGGYHGLYIELKRMDGGRVSPAQAEFIKAMTELGYCAQVRKGWHAAAELIMRYLEGKYEQDQTTDEKIL